MPTDHETRHARAHELLDLILATTDRDIRRDVETVDYDAMSDEELLKSDVGTRVRKILFRQLHDWGKEEYDKSQRRGAGSGIYGGVLRAAEWVYPEDAWDGFRDAQTWDPPYQPTDEARAELMRRIEAKGGRVDRMQVEHWATEIAEAHGWGEEEAKETKEAEETELAEAELWGTVQLARRTQSPLRRATVHKAPCAALSRAVKTGASRERTLDEVWRSIITGYFADGPEPPNSLTTLYTFCSTCGADKALQEVKGDALDAWKQGERLMWKEGQ